MELALNLVWLGVSAALLIFCGVHTMRAGEHRSRFMVGIAVVCLICLLFPVISMTDDLNCSPAMVESSKLKKLTASAHVVFTVLSWPVLLAPLENQWAALDRSPEIGRPLQKVFVVNLSRRPPPLQPRFVLS